ncbi:MAG: HAMP domain-containing sensor histidine kinase [Myxococcales bacterium]|nr:HAMP domain-containing histidine kinase [Myxococcales bacterium]HIK84922.1 HAMP domain-containing histidine kinase [Myxococcales bacterium]
MPRRSIGGPLAIGIISMVLVLALAIGWQILVWRDDSQAGAGLSRFDAVLFVLGSLFFLFVFVGVVWLCVKLVLEMRLNQSQRAFLDAVTHELKTPLSSFRLGLETLARHQLEPVKRGEFIDRMSEDLDRLERTVGSVLSAARAEETLHSKSSKDHVELLGLLTGNVEELRERHQLSEDAIEVAKTHPLDVRGNANELGLVFRNLFENAVKYSNDPVRIRVGIEEVSDGRVRVEISDDGIGIPKHELRRIFRRFYRAGRDVQRQVSGLGLGLFVVRTLLRKHGGRIVALSEGAGRGSRFVVTLRPA